MEKEILTYGEFKQAGFLGNGLEPVYIHPSWMEHFNTKGDISDEKVQALKDGMVVNIKGFWTKLDKHIPAQESV